MNTAAQKPQKTNSTDSLFGMALCGAFTGLAFGAPVAEIWQATEMTSGIYQDRFEAKARKEDAGSFELGVKKSLSGIFDGAKQTLAELDRATFKPSMKPSFSTPAFA